MFPTSPRRRRALQWLLVGGFLLTGTGATLGCRAAHPDRDWDAFRDRFMEAYFQDRPEFATYAGRHEFDGRLPDWSEAGLRSSIAQLHGFRDQASAIDTTNLDAPRRFERDYLVAQIDKDLFWLETAQEPWRNPAWYAGSLDPNVYVARPYGPLAIRLRGFVGWARAMPGALAQMRANLRTPLPKVYVAIGRIRFGGLIPFLEHDVTPVFAEVADTALQREFREATAGAVQALRETDAWFAARMPTATDSFAMGPDLFAKMLWATEGVDVPLDRLEALGRADLARNQKALAEACAHFAPGQPIPACMEKANAHKPAGGTVPAASEQLVSLERFIRDHDLVTIPGTEQALVRESPPYQRYNFAYIDPPGPYEHDVPAFYYVAPPDPHWTAAEQRAYLPGEANLLFVSVHEVWPGHFLQALHSNRSTSKFGQVFSSYAFNEGWAHYAEEMMWEAGLGNGDPEAHIGQLSNALLRNARFLSAIGLQARGMRVEESERLFREEAYATGPVARQQAARGTFDPAYLNYTLGKLMIMKLREDWTRDRGGRVAWKAFHDAFLSFGGPPIPLVRRAMLGPDGGPPL